MDILHEIGKQIGKLPAEQQEQVLRFVESLTAPTPMGENGANLCQFSSSLDPLSARQMTEAIEEEHSRMTRVRP